MVIGGPHMRGGGDALVGNGTKKDRDRLSKMTDGHLDVQNDV